MVAPVVTLTLGGTDISARVKAPAGSPSLAYGRGASFDGAQEAPGWCRIVVTNNDKAFNPRNAGSTYASVLKIGKAVRVTAVHNAVTYYLFHGFLRRIIPLEGFAELVCEDALFNYGRRVTNVAASVSRSISAFREAILDDIGEDTTANMTLDVQNGAEASIVYTGADGVDAANLLTRLNLATGAVHYIKPNASAYDYTTVERLTLQSRASAETWSDTDFANPFPEDLGAYDYTDEGIINQMRVEATPRLVEEDAVVVWSKDWMRVGPSVTRTRWARFDEPTFSQALTYTVDSGSGTVTLTPFARSAKIVFVSGASGLVIKDVAITGYRALDSDLDAGISEDATSISAYGELAGPTITSEFISSEGYAEALGGWYIYRYKDPRAKPAPVMVNRFPTQLVREVAERVTWTASEHSLSAVECLIRSFTTRVLDSGARWETTYQLEEVPAAATLFTLGGTAGQGLGVSAGMGY